MPSSVASFFFFFFFNDTATTEIYTLSLHDALPIWGRRRHPLLRPQPPAQPGCRLHPELPERIRLVGGARQAQRERLLRSHRWRVRLLPLLLPGRGARPLHPLQRLRGRAVRRGGAGRLAPGQRWRANPPGGPVGLRPGELLSPAGRPVAALRLHPVTAPSRLSPF